MGRIKKKFNYFGEYKTILVIFSKMKSFIKTLLENVINFILDTKFKQYMEFETYFLVPIIYEKPKHIYESLNDIYFSSISPKLIEKMYHFTEANHVYEELNMGSLNNIYVEMSEVKGNEKVIYDLPKTTNKALI